MNRRDLFRNLAALVLTAIPATRAAAAPVLDYSDQHGAFTLIGEDGPELLMMPRTPEYRAAPARVESLTGLTSVRMWVGDVEVFPISIQLEMRPVEYIPFRLDRGERVVSDQVTLAFG